MDLNYKKIYKERTVQEESLSNSLMKLWASSEVQMDGHLFARALGNSVEDTITNILKNMESKKKDSKDRAKFVTSFIDVLTKTLKSTKEFHKSRLGSSD